MLLKNITVVIFILSILRDLWNSEIKVVFSFGVLKKIGGAVRVLFSFFFRTRVCLLPYVHTGLAFRTQTSLSCLKALYLILVNC